MNQEHVRTAWNTVQNQIDFFRKSCYHEIGLGTAPITKKQQLFEYRCKGEIPIEKNIIVTDESGNQIGATYPKRARGLVKNGRARFVDDYTICLACPPDMEEPMDTNMTAKQTPDEQAITVSYIIGKIAELQQDNSYLHRVIDELSKMECTSHAVAHAPTDLAGQAKAEALGDVVRCRETTNQQLLRFYATVYNDLMGIPRENFAGNEQKMPFGAVNTSYPPFDPWSMGFAAGAGQPADK